ncbi:MAG: HAD-IIB family hydrolase [Clostridia bacterium]|nr:HAD-IIB family hydrolase [Clostridia bacterium]
MDFSKYMIVTDLDGTFLHKGKTVARNMEAVARFTANGGLFTMATGRIYETIENAVPNAAAWINLPAILCNGAYLYDYATACPRSQTFFTPADAKRLLDFIRTQCPDAAWRVSTPTGMRAERAAGFILRDIEAYGAENVQIAPTETWRLDDWYKLVFRAEWQELAVLRERFEAQFGDSRLIAFNSGHHFLEVQYRDCHKGTGLEKLRAYTDLSARTVIACGDFENDIEMLKAADVAVCPANAQESVKAVSDRVLCASEDGLIADVIEAIEAGTLEKRA